MVCLLLSGQIWSANADLKVAQFLKNDSKVDLQPYIQILADPDQSLTLNEIISGNLNDEFKSIQQVGNSFGFSSTAYWLRFTTQIDRTQEDTVLLQLEYPLIDHVSLFIPDGRGGFNEKVGGDSIAFSAREINYRKFLFVLPKSEGRTQTYFMRIQTEGSVQIALSLWTATAFIEEVDYSNFILGIYYGIMLLLMAAALASYIKIRDRLFLYYALYLFTYLIFQLSLNGISYQYLWPELPWFTSRATSAFVGLVVIGGTLFSGSFLQIWECKRPIVTVLFYSLSVFGAISVLLSLFGNYSLAVRLASAAGLLFPPIVIIGAICSVVSGYRPARYFLVAWGVFVLGVFVTGLLYIGLLPETFITTYAIQLGSTFEVVLLGYALMDRIELLYIQKENAIKQAGECINRLNYGLETQVEKRTKQLSESEAQLRTLIKTLPDLVWWKDPAGIYMGCNPKFERYFGATQADIIGKTDYDFVDNKLADLFKAADKEAITAGVPRFNIEELTFADDGHIELIETTKVPMQSPEGELIGVLGVGRNISERRRSERALLNNQKMEAIGQLTGGIAHDFNNILAIIIGNLNILKRQLVVDKKIASRIDVIQKSAQRAADLTRQLLSFSRNKADQQSVIHINQVLIDMDSLIVHSVTPAIEVKHQYADDLWLTEVDPGDFQDAVINLIINARDAMSGSGQLILQTTNCTLDEASCALRPELKAGDYVQLAVIDNGEGISSDQKSHIFEPFYTTKELGKGTGLGLAMVFGFIKRADGCVIVESEVGVGTTIRMYLPKSDGEVKNKVMTENDNINEQHRGRETILVVDDEEALLELAEEVLEELDYHVLTALNGKQALEILETEKNIALLLSDVLMPGGINGYELAERAMEMNPALKVLLASGYTSKSVIHKNQARFSMNMLTKPYNLSELTKRVRQLLDS